MGFHFAASGQLPAVTEASEMNHAGQMAAAAVPLHAFEPLHGTPPRHPAHGEKSSGSGGSAMSGHGGGSDRHTGSEHAGGDMSGGSTGKQAAILYQGNACAGPIHMGSGRTWVWQQKRVMVSRNTSKHVAIHTHKMYE